MCIEYKQNEEKLKRSIAYGIFLNELQSFEEAYATFPPPTPVRHKSSDYRYIPYYLYAAKGLPHPVVYKLYSISTNAKGSLVVDDYDYPEEYKEYQPTL